MSPRAVICIVGPTATGKTALAIELARRIGGEIVSADSMQVYRGMAVLSQAPGPAEKKRARHHLVGYLDPRREASVADFRRGAVRAIRAIEKKGKVPIVVGGSGLYVKALIDGLAPAPPADEAFRARMSAYAARYGSARLHARLAKVDPVSASRIHPHDVRRITRALEIPHTCGRTMTELAALTRGLKDERAVFLFGLTCPRDRLYRVIERRCDAMLATGAVREVKRLTRLKLSKTAEAILGYREIAGYLRGDYDLARAAELMKMNTRRFAKRQLSWFRQDARIRWFDVSRRSRPAIAGAIMRSVCRQTSR